MIKKLSFLIGLFLFGMLFSQKKEQLQKLGDEGGNAARVELLRRELAALAPFAG